MKQKKIGGVILVLSLLFAIMLFYIIGNLNDQSQVLGCNPSQECTQVSNSLSLSHFISGLISAIFAFGIYLLIFGGTDEAIIRRLERDTREKLESEKFNILCKALDSFERKVITSVKEQEGISQPTLRLRTNLSKAKLSRVLQDLEKKNLILRKKDKKTNLIYLSHSWKFERETI
jgi:uncharacterized membrane protein